MEDVISEIKKCKGDILWALSDGRAYTATELANYAHVDRIKVEKILDRFLKEEKLEVEQHRFRYFRWIGGKAIEEVLYEERKGQDKIYSAEVPLPAIKYCRSCHGHLAGKIGVEVAEKLEGKHLLVKEKVGEEYQFELTLLGEDFFKDLGINIAELRKKSGKFSKACLDFSERKHHLGGRLGVAFLNKLIEKCWVLKKENSRVKVLTPLGKRMLNEKLGLDLE
ncbi:MAG TPA: hypothetical protein VK084_05555 [Chitinophagaceae bacterium]|nr:hypothetical protein [Chitinophagaceae bacterium]